MDPLSLWRLKRACKFTYQELGFEDLLRIIWKEHSVPHFGCTLTLELLDVASGLGGLWGRGFGGCCIYFSPGEVRTPKDEAEVRAALERLSLPIRRHRRRAKVLIEGHTGIGVSTALGRESAKARPVGPVLFWGGDHSYALLYVQ